MVKMQARNLCMILAVLVLGSMTSSPQYQTLVEINYLYKSAYLDGFYQDGDILYVGYLNLDNWYRINLTNAEVTQILPENSTCQHTAGYFWMSRSKEFFCADSNLFNRSHMTINQVDPLNNMALINSYPTTWSAAPSFEFASDYIIGFNGYRSNLFAGVFNTKTSEIVCDANIALKENYFLIGVTYESSLIVAVYPEGLISYDCETNEFTNLTLAYEEGELSIDLESFNESSVIGLFKTTQNQKLKEAVLDLTVVSNQNNNLTNQGNFTFDGVMANQDGLNKINNTHFSILYTENGNVILGLFIFGANYSPVQVASYNFGNFGNGQNPFSNMYVLQGTQSIILMLNDDASVFIVNMNLMKLTYVNTPNLPLFFSNGSLVYYDYYGYFILNPGETSYYFVQAPLSNQYQLLSETDQIWFLHSPQAQTYQGFPKCLLTLIQPSVSLIQQIEYTTCPCLLKSDNFLSIIDVQPLQSSNQYQVAYQCDQNTLWVVNNTAQILKVDLPNVGATMTSVHINYQTEIVTSVYSQGFIEATIIQYSSLKTGKILSQNTLNTISDPTVLKISQDLCVFLSRSSFFGSELRVLNTTSGEVLQNTVVPQFIFSNQAITVPFLALGVNPSSYPYVSAFAFIDYGSKNAYLVSEDGEITFLQSTSIGSLMPVSNNSFAVGNVEESVILNYQIYEVTSWGS